MNDFDMDLARAAHRWTSMTPDVRAEQERESFVNHIASVRTRCAAYASSAAQRDLLDTLLAEYTEGYRTRLYAYLRARSRTASTMVTGGSGFDVRRNEKRIRISEKRGEELDEWHAAAVKQIIARLKAARTPEEVQTAEYERLSKDRKRLMEVVKGIDDGIPTYRGYNRSAFTTGLAGKLRTSYKHGNRQAVHAVLVDVHDAQADWAKPFFAERNTIWKLATAPAVSHDETPAPRETETLWHDDHCTCIANADLDRVQLHFERRPSSELRQIMKRSGWHWSPSQEAWQRKDTNAARYAAECVAAEYRRLAEAAWD